VRPLVQQLDLALGFQTAADSFWIDQFASLGNLVPAADDGSFGKKGTVIDAIKLLSEGRSPKSRPWDYVYACGPLPMLKAVKQHFAGHKVQGYVSLEERMACGVGACCGCVCQTADRTAAKRICADGPVFDWNEVAL
ncbi:MAG: dihydroorotate dehydrogenase electron transfer subunit, partial [Limnochordia bacterium]